MVRLNAKSVTYPATKTEVRIFNFWSEIEHLSRSCQVDRPADPEGDLGLGSFDLNLVKLVWYCDGKLYCAMQVLGCI